jgi:hypothetical protein
MFKKPIHKIILPLLSCMMLIGACAPAGEVEIAPSATATLEAAASPTEAPTATPVPSPTPTPLPLDGQQTQYFIDATINYYNRFISASSRVIYTNKTQVPLNEIVFIIYPTIFQDAIFIRSIKLGDGTPVSIFNWESHRMLIPLDEPLLPGEQIEIVHDFELYMPNREGTFGQTGRQLNLAYWFPIIPPYDEEQGWLVYEISIVNSMIVGEHLVFESADFDVTLQFSDRRENFTIAAGAPADENDGVIRYQLELARTFTISISDIYTVTQRQVDGITILSYAFPEDISSGEAAADIAVEAVRLYSELFGPSERDLISVVEADFLHGMEFDGLILLSRGFYMFYDGTPKTNLTIITPHEISHQWFFSLVGNNQAMEPWLDETLATYTEVLFYERYYPDLVEWWWENRVDGHGPSGFVDNTIFLEAGYDAYRNSVYLNGARFMQELRDAVGEDAFFSFLYDYVQSHRYQIATGEDFWRTLRAHTDTDLTDIVGRYFSQPPDIP